jgi:hypothetical protein
MSREIDRLLAESQTRRNYLPTEDLRDTFQGAADLLIRRIVEPLHADVHKAIDGLKPDRARDAVTAAVKAAQSAMEAVFADNRAIEARVTQMRATARKLRPQHPEQAAEHRAAMRELTKHERIMLVRHTDSIEAIAALLDYAGPPELALVPQEEADAAAQRLGNAQLAKAAAELEMLYTNRQLLSESAARAIVEIARRAGVSSDAVYAAAR